LFGTPLGARSTTARTLTVVETSLIVRVAESVLRAACAGNVSSPTPSAMTSADLTG
jgi:hypothetical protein